MALRIDWTTEAEFTYDAIVFYLEQEWSEREVKNFISRVNEVLKLISKNPMLYKRSKQKGIHEAVVSKHNTLYYRVKTESIDLLNFWDNRQSSEKLKLRSR